jgi:hypothetical protein
MTAEGFGAQIEKLVTDAREQGLSDEEMIKVLSRHSRDGQRKGRLPELAGHTHDGKTHHPSVGQPSGTCLAYCRL